MSSGAPQPVMDVVLCWHMHQPCYLSHGTFREPWTYLHAIKDYADMAAHLEGVPGARAVVNFSPVLLDQIEICAESLGQHLESGARVRDPLLDALARHELPEAPEARGELVERCLAVDEHRVLNRFPAYGALAAIARQPGALPYLTDAFFGDLLTWFHLAWLGEHRRRSDEYVRGLLEQGRGFSRDQQRRLLGIVHEEIAGLVPRYRALAEAGRVELATSPWGHPIVPLLLDLGAGRRTVPDGALPEPDRYPGGASRARWHLRYGLERFEHHFGLRPRGCWPSEGAVCSDTASLLHGCGFEWFASSAAVLEHSLPPTDRERTCRHQPFVVDGGIRGFFRDDGLSDLIGFTYKDWDAGDAVANLVQHLENIAAHYRRDGLVTPIIMDGENAWEHYPDNAWAFLECLYERLAEHPRLRLRTFAEVLDDPSVPAAPLGRLVPGSWVHGTLATWVGHPDKNRAWNELSRVKAAFDRRFPDGEAPEALDRLLGACEGSDWFWWLGDDNAESVVSRFESLFREHLRALYGALDAPLPPTLEAPIAVGARDGVVRTMRGSRD